MTSGPMVTVLRNKFVRGYPDPPGAQPGERVHTMSLARALTREFTTDAHCVQYTAPGVKRRLSRDALSNGVVAGIDVFILDVDCPETHGSPEPAPESWRADLRAKLAALYDAHPGLYYYATRGGARIVYRTPWRFSVATTADARDWAQWYAITVAYMERRFGIVADQACADWTRLFRLPHATRTPGAQPEQWEAIGDPEDIGVLDISAGLSVDDLLLARSRSKAFVVRQDLDLTPCTGDGQGMFFHALRARGDILRARPNGGYFIRCPRESHHTSGKTGDSSTILYPPSAGKTGGQIHCLHGHCVNMTFQQWKAEFTADEIEAADKASGR